MAVERIIGLDVGDVRIGVAVSDPLGSMALPRGVIQRGAPETVMTALHELIEETEASRIVVGLPLNQHGEPGPQAEKVQRFAEELERRFGLPVDTQDERFSTAEAERTLIGADVSRKNRRRVIDKLAAQHILQTYLDRRTRGEDA